MALSKEDHEKKVADALEKARGLGKTEGMEWVIATRERLIGGGMREILAEHVEESVIQVGVFKTDPARVVMQKGLTINLGNFESARVTVGFECPCYVEETQQIADALNAMIEAKLQQEVMDIRGKDIRPGYEAQRAGGK